MNDSRIQIFGQSMEGGSDELFTYVCCPCDKKRRYKEARKYCGHCDVLYCKHCLKKEQDNHLGHTIVKVSDWGEKNNDRCQACRRDGCRVSRYCADHDEYCCYQCAKDKHRECNAISEIGELARGVYTSKDFEAVKQEVVKKTDDTSQLTSNKKKDRNALQDSKRTSVGRLTLLRKKVNDIFDKLEKDANDEINANYDEDDYKFDSDIEECEDVLAGLRCLRMYMESKTATESQMFLKLEQIRDKLVDFDMQLIERESSQPMFEEYEFTEDPTVLNFLESIDTLKLQRNVPEPESVLPDNQPALERSITTDETADRPQSTMRTMSPVMAESSTATKTESSSRETASGLKQSTTSTTCGTQSKSQLRDVRRDAETPSQARRRSEENATPLLNATNAAPQHNTDINASTGDQSKTTMKLDVRPELKISMDVKVDAHETYSQNESPNIKKELHEGPSSTAHAHVSSLDLSPQHVNTSESEKSVQDCKEPKTPKRTTATPTFPKTSSILPGKVSDVSCLYNRRSSRDNMTLPQKINIRLPMDNHTCNIQGMFGLKNGNILLSDTKNKKLKLVDQSYKIIASCELTAGPRGVSEAGDYQAVAAMNNKTIQFVTMVDSKSLIASRCITLGHDCYGISHCNGKMYVTELNGKCVHVYDTNGESLYNISVNDMAGLPRFGRTQHVYVTRDGARIYVADAMKGLVIVSPKGATLASITQPGLLSACGVCTDTSGNVYVSGLQSHNVMKFGEKGTKMQHVVATPDSGVNYPTSVWFNSSKSELIVSNNPNPFGDDFLNVYKVAI